MGVNLFVCVKDKGMKVGDPAAFCTSAYLLCAYIMRWRDVRRDRETTDRGVQTYMCKCSGAVCCVRMCTIRGCTEMQAEVFQSSVIALTSSQCFVLNDSSNTRKKNNLT